MPPQLRTRATLTSAAALAIALLTPGCDSLDGVFGGQCENFSSQYATDLAKSGELHAEISQATEHFPMALVLNQVAVNTLFQQLSDLALPTLRQNLMILGQEVTIAIDPQIPLLGIGGNQRCIECFSANVPFSIGIGFNNNDPPRGSGALAVQMPIGLMAEGDRKSALVASFQSLEVTGFQLDVGGSVGNNVLTAIEPVINTLLTEFLRSRFENARVATFDSWAIGQGDVLLAGRGPFVFPEQQTIMIAMQSNLKIDDGSSLAVQSQLPEGADIGFVFHPNLMLAMSRRMNYEGVIPHEYDGTGEPSANGGTQLSMMSMDSNDEGLLRTNARIWRTKSFCGTADLTAALGLVVEPGRFAFQVQDVQIVDGQGAGQLLSNSDWIASGFVNSLLDTLDFTVNYDQVFGGEVQSQAPMSAFRATIDAQGISVFLNIVDTE